MPLLQKRPKPSQEGPVDKPVRGKKRRQKFFDFFKSRRWKQQDNIQLSNTAPPSKQAQNIKSTEYPERVKQKPPVEECPATPSQLLTPPAEPTLSEEDLQTIFSGAPQFAVTTVQGRREPIASCPWDASLLIRDITDSLPLSHPAFASATLRKHIPISGQHDGSGKAYVGYNTGAAEIPSMLSAQGIERGTVGFDHFLQLPISDNLATSIDEYGVQKGLSESVRNRELMHNNPEKLGIRSVDSAMIHERLIEFEDLWQSFREESGTTTILNKHSPGELYANLFGKFLTPPRFDPDAGDPTGLKVQIETLLKILKLTGFWYDFSLVEWRIRLGQILWSADEPALGDETPDVSSQAQVWTGRDILLLQISLACELLLRLDAVSAMTEDEVTSNVHLTAEELKNFTNLKSRKTDWDLVLARRFLENVLVMIAPEKTPLPPSSKLLGFFSSVLAKPEQPKAPSKSDIILLPRHQSLQLSGLLRFAETLVWPNIDLIATELIQKLNIPDASQVTEGRSNTLGKFLDPSTPASPSIYSTPLATPRSGTSARNSYFGSTSARPPLSRTSTQRSLQFRPSSILLGSNNDKMMNAFDIGGWLSRAYLTGLVLPGETISHFLMSTLLENDKLAIVALGDSANLYGGFIYRERSWWSKSSIVGRVLAAMEGAVECMGWLSIPKLPAGCVDGWVNVPSKQIQLEKQARIEEEDAVARASTPIPSGNLAGIKPKDLTLPQDSLFAPAASIQFLEWSLIHNTLTPESENIDNEKEEYTVSLAFSLDSVTHTFSLHHDIHFISSFPCTPPSAPIRLLSRTASKRVTLNRRNSHGFEPLSSHPPDSDASTPMPSYFPEGEGNAETKEFPFQLQRREKLLAHPLHVSYKYRIVDVAKLLDSSASLPIEVEDVVDEDEDQSMSEILVIDARADKDLDLLARAWCADKGVHAIIGRTGRTCLGCCVREARGLGVAIVIRV